MKYCGINIDQIKEQAKKIEADDKEKGGNFSSDIVSKPFVDGANYLWLCPPRVGSPAWFVYRGTHWNLRQPDGSSAVCDCATNTTSHGRCPVCDVLTMASAFMDVGRISESGSYYINVVKLVLSEADGLLYPERQRPYIYRISQSVYKGLIKLMAQPKVGDITDPFNGFILKVTKPAKMPNPYEVDVVASDGSAIGIERGMMPTPKELEGSVEAQQRWIEGVCENIHDFNKIFKPIEGEVFEKILNSAKGFLEYCIGKGLSIDASILDEYETADFTTMQSDPVQEAVNSEVWDGKKDDDKPPFEVDNTAKEAVELEDNKDKSLEQQAEEANVSSDDFITIDKEDYLVSDCSNGILTVENEDGDVLYTCEKWKDKTYKTSGWVEKHIEKEHSAKQEEKSVPKEKVKQESKEEKKAEVKEKSKEEDSDGKTYTNSSGVQVKIRCKNFGNYGNDDLCNSRLRKICEYKDMCKEETDNA